MSAVCDWCDQEMAPGNGCTLKVYDDFAEAPGDHERIPYDNPRQKPDGHCHDCNVSLGQLHHPGCDMERCPLCKGQAISCYCSEPEPEPARSDGVGLNISGGQLSIGGATPALSSRIMECVASGHAVLVSGPAETATCEQCGTEWALADSPPPRT